MDFFSRIRAGFNIAFGNRTLWLKESYEPEYHYDKLIADDKKIKAVFSNPAVLSIIKTSCDLFSLGLPVLKDSNGNIVENHPVLDKLKNPNYFQSTRQFFWDYMFWRMIGNSWLYLESKLIDQDHQWYFLDVSKIEIPDKITEIGDKLILSKNNIKEIDNTLFDYVYNNGTVKKIPFKSVRRFHDNTNGVGNWFYAPSTLDALYKVISNSDNAINAKNVNIRYSGKFLVSGKSDANDQYSKPMGKEEKTNIEEKTNKKNKVISATSTMVDIKRYVENIDKLKLNDAYLQDYFIIGNMFNIPRDVLEAYQSSTYENQEKARGSHISYSIQPSADDFTDGLLNYYGLEGFTLKLDYSHLPFMQVFEADRADVITKKVSALESLIRIGYTQEEATSYLNMDI